MPRWQCDGCFHLYVSFLPLLIHSLSHLLNPHHITGTTSKRCHVKRICSCRIKCIHSICRSMLEFNRLNCGICGQIVVFRSNQVEERFHDRVYTRYCTTSCGNFRRTFTESSQVWYDLCSVMVRDNHSSRTRYR